MKLKEGSDMGLTLDEKQLLSSLSDLITLKPDYASYLFSQHDIKSFPYYNDLGGVVALIERYKRNEINAGEYFNALTIEISKIQNPEIRSVLQTSLNYAHYIY